MLTERYFQEKDFNKTKIFEEFVDNLNKNPPQFDLKYFSAHDLVIQFKRKTLILFKLLLLQKKNLFMLSPIEHLVNNSKLNSFVIGANNGLFRQQNNIDFYCHGSR